MNPLTQTARLLSEACDSSFDACNPIAVEVGMITLEMMLFLYSKEPETGLRIPSISTRRVATKVMMKEKEKVSYIN